MKLGQKIGVNYRSNRDGFQTASRKRQCREPYRWNAFEAVFNDRKTVRVIRKYLAEGKRQAA